MVCSFIVKIFIYNIFLHPWMYGKFFKVKFLLFRTFWTTWTVCTANWWLKWANETTNLLTWRSSQVNQQFWALSEAPVELPYISCKNLAEVVHIRHYLQESCKNLTFQTNLSDSGWYPENIRINWALLGSSNLLFFYVQKVLSQN